MAYATIADARLEGLPGTADDDFKDNIVQERLDYWSEFMDQACRQWFEPRTLTMDLDGTDSRVLFLPVPVISITSFWMNGGFAAGAPPVEAATYSVYSSKTALRDDRRNPKITISSTALGIFDLPHCGSAQFVRGTQNQRIVGSFGFVEADASTPSAIKRAVLKLTLRQFLRTGVAGDGTMWSEIQAPAEPAGKTMSETTDGHTIVYDTTKLGAQPIAYNGTTNDAEVDDIIRRFRGPIIIGTPVGAGGPDRRWR